MSRRWVVNASPLILLDKIGHLALLGELSDETLLPEAVAQEIGARPGGERALAIFRDLPGARIAAEVPLSSELLAWDLGRGESQVLALATGLPGSRAVLDDLAARRAAQAINLPLIGTLGIVLRAKRRGLIDAARPVIENLRRVGLYVSDTLIEQALDHLGE